MDSNRIRISVSGNFHLAAEIVLKNQNIYTSKHCKITRAI